MFPYRLSLLSPRLLVFARRKTIGPCSGMAILTDNHWTRVQPRNDLPPYSLYNRPIKKPDNDDRQYKIIQLDNGLQATLIHDASTDKAAASLDVAVGHLSDPDDMPGLAHFCEHLLFMGTDTFPGENAYTEYLAKNNGMSNAFTSTSNTNYYFNVATPALRGALERFSAFFHCPLFSPSCTSREINAVDSEHQKNQQSDIWRVFQLNKHLSKKGHVWSKFGSGSRYSLLRAARRLKQQGLLNPTTDDISSTSTPVSSRIPSPAPSSPCSTVSAEGEADPDGGPVGRETRRRLLEWWTQEYCASRMRLCIIGKESLDELAELASRLFSPIQNRGRDPLPMIEDHPFGTDQKGTLVAVHTVMDFHIVEISFPLEYQAPQWKYKPANFISHLLGHEGSGSLLSYLKNKRWATSVSSGPQSLARGFAMFKLTINMTKLGFQNHRSVILAAYKYLSLLRSSDFEPYLQKELSMLSMLQFRFSEKQRPDSYATWITERMGWPVPRDSVVSAAKLMEDWRDDPLPRRKVKEYLESFRIDQGRAVLMAKGEEHANLTPDAVWSKERWYSTEYRVERFDEEFIKLANGPNDIPELFLPEPNEFMPSNLDVDKKEVAEPGKRPRLIRETPLSQLWHKKDDRFWIPKAHVSLEIRSPFSNESPRTSVITRLYCDLVNDSLAEFSYNAGIAGLTYKLLDNAMGLVLTTSGYNDKMPLLLEHILDRIKNLNIDPERLEVMKEQANRSWGNFYMGQPFHQSDYYGKYLLAEKQWTVEEKLQELNTITATEIQAHIKKLLSRVQMRILVVGNIFKEEAIKIAELADAGFVPSNISNSEVNEHALIIPQESNYIWSSKLVNPNQVNSALTYYLHFGTAVDQRLRVTSALLVKILTEPAFNVLRTKEQLGYVVICSPWTLPGGSERGFRIVIQSGKLPGYLECRVEAFLDRMKDAIEQMSDNAFQEYKTGLEKRWLEADKNLAEEAARFMVHVSSGQLDFLGNENDAYLLKDITKDDVLSLYLSHVHPSSTTRAKLSIHMQSQKPPKRISIEAAQAFAALVKEAGYNIDDADWREIMGSEGAATPGEFIKHWIGLFDDMDKATSLLAALPELVEKYPVEGEGQDVVQQDAHYIQDSKTFKSSLPVSADQGPLVQWGDLPLSRL